MATLDAQKKIVPQEVIMNGNPDDKFFRILKKDGTEVLAIYGDGKMGFFGKAPAVQQSALSAAAVAAASFTHTAPGVDDFAIQALTATSPVGFVTTDEGNSVLKALKNAILRIEELETKLKALGLIA